MPAGRMHGWELGVKEKETVPTKQFVCVARHCMHGKKAAIGCQRRHPGERLETLAAACGVAGCWALTNFVCRRTKDACVADPSIGCFRVRLLFRFARPWLEAMRRDALIARRAGGRCNLQ